MIELTVAQKEKLVGELRQVVADAEELLKATADDASEGVASLRARLQQRMSDARVRLMDLQASATDKARAAGHAADDFVHQRPWSAVAMGAGVGLIVGLLIGRR
ncbi:MAG TPA: DUF883 family protein [Rubrivivax sp.]|nr:DUF883 family protein [Burkholderiales bacterium]HNU11293.1 DUF883 family protein [Rubrivivax sp.]